MKIFLKLFVLILLQNFFYSSSLEAQATLSIQGILKRANGDAVDDGSYAITFRLYEQESGSTSNAIWTETQNDVDVFNGIYSAVLGQTTALNVPFDQLYYLGVTIGSSELSPRILLTSAPYALSLIGSTNQFPSSGKVLADSIIVNGGVKVTTGAPGSNGINQKGYSFTGDGDSGLFSPTNGEVSIYSNNVEKLAVTPTNVEVKSDMNVTGEFSTEGVTLTNNSSISYAAGNDWRLVETDYFQNNSEGWNVYNKLSGYLMGWNNGASLGASPTVDMGSFIGKVLLPNSNDHVLKKQFTVAGSFTQIKIKFRYYYIDSWGWGGGDRSWAGFSSNAQGSDIRVGFMEMPSGLSISNNDFSAGPVPMSVTGSFYGTTNIADSWTDAEMTAQASGNSFWVFIGAAVDQATADERYAVGAIEVYVK
jgi:hypothetical protein